MSVATGTAIALGVGAASSLAGAKMASNASKNAAKTQSAAADKALAAQQQGYQQQRQDFMPYQQQGTAAMGRLGQTAGTYTGGMPRQAVVGGSNAPGGPMPQPMPPTGPQAPPQGPPMGQLGMAQAGGQMAPPGQPGGTVRVQAPTGEIAMLPMAQAQAAVAKGAKILGPSGMTAPQPGGMMS